MKLARRLPLLALLLTLASTSPSAADSGRALVAGAGSTLASTGEAPASWESLGAPRPAAPPPVDPAWQQLGAPAHKIRRPLQRDPVVERRIDDLLAKMSVEDKVGQLLFVGFGGTEVEQGGAIEQLVKGKKVGGVALFSRNVKSIPQVGRFTRELRDLLPELPPFIAVDQEGGNVVRLREPTTVLPSNMALGAARDLDLTRRAAASLGHDLWLLGFNMNLAPVLDVNSNPANPVIGIRSFGEDPNLVGGQGGAYVQGLQSADVSAVAKHFPGHGDTGSDSHYDMPSLPHDTARLLSVELVPFQQAIDANLDAVMTAHIALPAVEGVPGVPATVSHRVLTGLLRETLGFEGIIITDGLEMKGIVDAYGSGPAAVKAVQSGADMVLILWTKEKKEEVHQHLLTAVREGTISRERLDLSVRRILRAKIARGVLDRPPPGLDAALAELGTGERGRKIAQEVADRSLTLVRKKEGLTPIDRTRYRKIVLLSGDGTLATELSRRLPELSVVRTRSVPNRARKQQDVERTIALCKGADLLIVGVLNRYHTEMLREVRSACSKPTVVVSLGSPYLLGEIQDVDAYLTTYSYRETAAKAAARFLAGEIPAPGVLPVSLPGLYPVGHTAEAQPAATAPGRKTALASP
ncbi:MAG: glycoside hydrolase family 3 protein [Deltaproteobacteria bacterium]|nr:glycoside hydrolase family 3 protein [Deltaproteobacteria bacterium]